ncbi:fibronectin type III domain-containing protein [Bergeyella zoohelcum]|uniref:TANFOR domain n=1 Tax=Bergeyella zoohelcum TaxID=1015 RepID=A0A7Z9CEV7_9FLAO|nr:fibronectin type III domain-containing protein [Bergeyella zoohelcum]VDH02636.1 TANFOR domain [Bergeyella zoohelcum]
MMSIAKAFYYSTLLINHLMKRKAKDLSLRFLAFLILGFSIVNPFSLNAQQYPVRVTPVVLAPYSLKLSDYATTTQQKLQVQILMTDLMQPAHQTGLKFSLEAGLNAQPFARSNEFVVGLPPFNLYPGTPVTLSNIDLRPLFELQNLNGISALQYSKALPEGAYQFCFQAFDFYTKNNLSAKSCATVYLTQYDPPQLNLPQRAEKIQANNNTPIIFQWLPRQVAPNTQYTFILKELWDLGQSPEAGFLASRTLWQETSFAPMVYYGLDKPQLIPGKRYAWQVQAKSGAMFDTAPNNDNGVYKNNGLSEIFYFDYVENCLTPTFLMAKNIGRARVELSWSSTGQNNGLYRIQYRKKNSQTQWQTAESYQTRYTITGLEDHTEYEYRIGSVCGQLATAGDYFDNNFANNESAGNAYAFSGIQYFTTDSKDAQNTNYQCGVMPNIEISNKNLLQSVLGTNETFTAGDFPVTIIDAQGSNGIYSGIGYVQVPYLADTKIKVVFNNIQLNTDRQLISGVVETSYDVNEENVIDIKSIKDLLNDFNAIITKENPTREDIKRLEDEAISTYLITIIINK